MQNDQTLPITSGRVTLRRLTLADLPMFLDYRSDEVVAQYQSWGEADEDSARRLITHMAAAPIPARGEWSQIAVADASGVLLGDMGLHLSGDGKEAEIGITLSRSAQGSGIASEAVRAAIAFLFLDPTLHKIVAIADKRNTAAIRCMAGAGFTFSHDADFVEGDGSITPEVHYYMMRP